MTGNNNIFSSSFTGWEGKSLFNNLSTNTDDDDVDDYENGNKFYFLYRLKAMGNYNTQLCVSHKQKKSNDRLILNCDELSECKINFLQDSKVYYLWLLLFYLRFIRIWRTSYENKKKSLKLDFGHQKQKKRFCLNNKRFISMRIALK